MAETIKIRILESFEAATPHGRMSLHAGQTIEVDSALGEWLLRDAPGAVERVVSAETLDINKAFFDPPADKMMRRGRTKEG